MGISQPEFHPPRIFLGHRYVIDIGILSYLCREKSRIWEESSGVHKWRIACDLPNRSCCFTAMNWYTHIYIHLRILRKPMSTKHNEVWTQGSVSTCSWCLQYLGTFQKPPVIYQSCFWGWRYRKPPSSWAYCSGYLQISAWNQKHSAGWEGTWQDIDWPRYVSWIFECEIWFLPWDPLGDPDPTAPVRELMLHLLGQNHVESTKTWEDVPSGNLT